MTNDENILHTSANKSKVLRNANRVSFSETINGSESSPENEYETATKSSSTSALKRTTPILFSTNRGLHLRVTSSANNNSLTKTRGEHDGAGGGSRSSSVAANLSRSSATTTTINSSYSITFCDLERWSTNRANTVSLEDTFTIARPPVVLSQAPSGSLASNSLRFLPHCKTNSMRFKGYARFDVE